MLTSQDMKCTTCVIVVSEPALVGVAEECMKNKDLDRTMVSQLQLCCLMIRYNQTRAFCSRIAYRSRDGSFAAINTRHMVIVLWMQDAGNVVTCNECY